MIAKRRVGTMMLAIGLAGGAAVVSTSLPAATTAKTPKVKRVRLAVLNDSGESLELMAGTKEIQLESKARIALTLQVGEKITVINATKNYKAGEAWIMVGNELNGATVVVD
jgi:translation elongation factor P/translation initiation factor 5A